MQTLTLAQQASAAWIDLHGADDTPQAQALRGRIGKLFRRGGAVMN